MQDFCVLSYEYENPKRYLNLGGYSGYEAYNTRRENRDRAYEKDQNMLIQVIYKISKKTGRNFSGTSFYGTDTVYHQSLGQDPQIFQSSLPCS